MIFGYSAVLPKKSGQRPPGLELGTLSWYVRRLATRPSPPLSPFNLPYLDDRCLGNHFVFFMSLQVFCHSYLLADSLRDWTVLTMLYISALSTLDVLLPIAVISLVQLLLDPVFVRDWAEEWWCELHGGDARIILYCVGIGLWFVCEVHVNFLTFVLCFRNLLLLFL